MAYYSLLTTSGNNHHLGLNGKKEVVTTISGDANGKAYTVYAYSSSIYTFEYSYLFKWLAEKDVPFDPSKNPQGSETVYLIVPLKQDANVADFINYRTPNALYHKVKQWEIPENAIILKETKKSKNQ
jgi:hypothetical protein